MRLPANPPKLVRDGAEESAWPLVTAILLGLLMIALALTGCASPAQKVLKSVNGYEFYMARYAEFCPTPSPAQSPECKAKATTLRRWSKALDEAGAALKRGGAFPLQLKRLKETEKEMVK